MDDLQRLLIELHYKLTHSKNNNNKKENMSYLAQQTSVSEYGVVKIGSNINVSNGIISIPQDCSANANVTFYNANITNQLSAANANVTGNLYANGSLVVTSVNPSSGPGISLSNVVTGGYNTKFTINNTGVLSLIPGTGISISSNTGNVTVSTTGTSYINVIGVTSSYTPTSTDEYVGVYSASAITITLPVGIPGRLYIIKDEYGQGSGKITLQPQTGDLIDGKPNYVISVPYQAVNIVYRANTWWIV